MKLFKNKEKEFKTIQLTKTEDNEEKKEEQKVYRAVIDDMLFDTSKAEKICDITIGFGITEELYETDNLERFTVSCGHIYRVTDEWLKEKLKYNVDAYIKVFGEPDEA